MARVTPNGRRIKQLREEAGLKQSDLVERLRVSVRWYRDVENESKKIGSHKLDAIAAILHVSSSELKIPDPIPVTNSKTTADDRLPTPDRGFVELQPVEQGLDLYNNARFCGRYEWSTEIEPTQELVSVMERILSIVRRCTSRYAAEMPVDEFTPAAFPELHMMAAARSSIETLKAAGISVLGAMYSRSVLVSFPWSSDDYERSLEWIYVLKFVPATKTSDRVQKIPDQPHNPRLEGSRERPDSATYIKPDDDIPF